MAGREVATGLSALLYHQQEKAASGYDRAAKPLKQAARVMLAVGTKRANKRTAEVAVLDFGVGADGRLAQLDGEVALANRSAPRPDGHPDVDWGERDGPAGDLDSAEKLMAVVQAIAGADHPAAALAAAPAGTGTLGDDVPEDAAAVLQAAFDAWADKVRASEIDALLAERDEARVTLYEDIDYGGGAQTFGLGAQDLSGGRERRRCVRPEPRCRSAAGASRFRRRRSAPLSPGSWRSR